MPNSNQLANLATGLANGINAYLGKQQDAELMGQKYQMLQKAMEGRQEDVAAFKEKGQEQLAQYKTGLGATQLDPQTAEGLVPGGADFVNDFQKQNGRLPTLKEGISALNSKSGAEKTSNTGDKNQDSLEKQATDRLTSVRGDQAIQRTENQRDAAGMAYDTIAKAQHERRPLTQMEQTDVLGQLWKSRTGAAPTDTVLKDLDQRTSKQGFNQVVTYVTGNPSLVGSSTDETLNNIKQFVVSTGQKADQQHEGYMKPRLIKPTGLDDDRWNHVLNANRGLSFADQQQTSDKTYPQAVNYSPNQSSNTSGWSVVK